jgi:hypothetical protein
MVTMGRVIPVVGVSTSARVAGRPVCTDITIDALLITSCPVIAVDASCAPASCCPSTDAVAAADGPDLPTS